MQNTPKNMRLVIAIFAGLGGIFLVCGAPFIVQISLDRVLEALAQVSQESPKYASGLTLFSFFYPLWRALGFVAGITLLGISPSIIKGQDWTFPVALSAHAVPSVSGMFMFLPYISWVGGFPLPMVISWIGLAGFWATLLFRSTARMKKIVDFLVYTFIGMLTTHAFVIGIAAQRMLMTRPDKPFFGSMEWWILTVSGEVNWIGVILFFISIPMLAKRKVAGWWLAFISALSILVVNVPTQIIRTNTLDYLYGALLAVGLLIFLFIPKFKKLLLEES
jgi:hypothetical protein